MHKQMKATKAADHEIDMFVSNEKLRLRTVLLKISRSVRSSLSPKFEEAVRKDLPIDYNNLVFSPEEQIDSQDARYNLFMTEVLSKSVGFFEPLNTEEAGYRKFKESEVHCRITNQRLYVNEPERDVEACIFYMRRQIANILGDLPSSQQLSIPDWGDGSTKTIKGTYTKLDKLMEYPIQISSSLWQLYSNYLSEHWAYASYLSNIDNVCGPFCLTKSSYTFDDIARVSMVPKTSKTDRPITVEPTANVAITKAYGLVIRKRLKRKAGIDLEDQSRNQELAKQALEKDLATVDLSSASDLISLLLINLIFPPKWAELILKLRTPKYKYRSDIYTFEKFAGMGNGATFPIETLIFYSAAYAVCKHLHLDSVNLSVYGDDIILPSRGVELLSKLFDYLGFKINRDKTHYLPYDLFRESCGMQTFNGFDITPTYIKEVGTDFGTTIRNHNRLFRWIARSGRFDLFPILGTLRPQTFKHQLFVDVYEDLPEEDEFFFVWRGESCTDLKIVKNSQYKRHRSSDYLWLSLLLLEKKGPDLPLMNCVSKSTHILWRKEALKNSVGLKIIDTFDFSLNQRQ